MPCRSYCTLNAKSRRYVPREFREMLYDLDLDDSYDSGPPSEQKPPTQKKVKRKRKSGRGKTGKFK